MQSLIECVLLFAIPAYIAWVIVRTNLFAGLVSAAGIVALIAMIH